MLGLGVGKRPSPRQNSGNKLKLAALSQMLRHGRIGNTGFGRFYPTG